MRYCQREESEPIAIEFALTVIGQYREKIEVSFVMMILFGEYFGKHSDKKFAGKCA